MAISKFVAGAKGAAGNSTGAEIAETVNNLVDTNAGLSVSDSAAATLNSSQLKQAMDNAGKTAAEVVAGTAEGQAGAAVLNYGYFADTSGLVRLSDGQIVDDTNWLYSDLYRISAGEIIVMNLYAAGTVAALAFYDGDENYISGVASTFSDQDVTVPDGTVYFRMCRGNPDTYPASVGRTVKANVTKQMLDIPILERQFDTSVEVVTKVNNESEALKSASDFYDLHLANHYERRLDLSGSKKTILYGDSISSTDYPWAGERMAEITGGQVYAAGIPGATMGQLTTQARMDRIFGYNPDLIVIFAGGNDTGRDTTVGTFSGYVEGEVVVPEIDITGDYDGTYNVQAMDYIVRKVKDYYYDIRSRANLTGSETEEEKTAKIDAVVKPQIVLCTPIPQNRYTVDHVYSQPLNWKRKRDCVIEVARKNNVHCVDLYTMWLQQVDMSQEPFWETPTDINTNNGIYTMDGLHPNKWGARMWIEMVAANAGI